MINVKTEEMEIPAAELARLTPKQRLPKPRLGSGVNTVGLTNSQFIHPGNTVLAALMS